MIRAVLLACALAVIWPGSHASAHQASTAFLRLGLEGTTITGQWDVALRDLDLALGLDADGDGALRYGELRARREDVAAYLLPRLELRADGSACPIEAGDLAVDAHAGTGYAVLFMRARCAREPKSLDIGYDLLFALDAQHRGIARVTTRAGERALVFAAGSRAQTLSVSEGERLPRLAAFVREGVQHIFAGLDHVIFLLTLLLPAVLVAEQGRLQGAPRLWPALSRVLAVVTSFTLAHSLTLSAAALGVIAVPSRLVESGIALSVLFAALGNLWPRAQRRPARIAFAFGLVHGLGFATALADLGLGVGGRVAALIGFNVGVELGQLAIVAVFVPLAWLGRESWLYQRVALGGGSLVAAGLAVFWLTERSL